MVTVPSHDQGCVTCMHGNACTRHEVPTCDPSKDFTFIGTTSLNKNLFLSLVKKATRGKKLCHLLDRYLSEWSRGIVGVDLTISPVLHRLIMRGHTFWKVTGFYAFMNSSHASWSYCNLKFSVTPNIDWDMSTLCFPNLAELKPYPDSFRHLTYYIVKRSRD